MDNKKIIYLGDGLYVEHDYYQIRLFASNGVETTNEVFLEQNVLTAFLKYIDKLKENKLF